MYITTLTKLEVVSELVVGFVKELGFMTFFWLPDNCAPCVIIYTGTQLSGSGAQLSGPGAQLSGPGAQLSAILVCAHTYIRHICAPVHVQ